MQQKLILTWNSYIENKLRKSLLQINNLISVKTGTEVEAFNFEEISFLKKICNNITPLTVKISGPEARNDIQFLSSIKVDKILAPMIESKYSLENFVESVHDIFYNKPIQLAINIETITAYENLHKIFSSKCFKEISSVTIGRSDLSRSMNLNVDNIEVFRIVRDITDLSKILDKKVSIGGQLNINNCQLIKEIINPHYINTRHIVLECNDDINNSIIKALLWEKQLYEALKQKFKKRIHFYNKRIQSINNRLFN